MARANRTLLEERSDESSTPENDFTISHSTLSVT